MRYGMKADCWQALAVAITDSERSAVERAGDGIVKADSHGVER